MKKKNKKSEAPPPKRVTGVIAGVAAGLFFVSGACGLVYEVAWTRQFSLTAGGATRALTAVLVAYMGGLALGSFLGGRLVDRRVSRPVLVYGLLEGAIGVLAVLTTLAIPGMLPVLKAGKAVIGGSALGFDFFRFLVSAAVMLLPTTAMGATFPVLLRGVLANKDRFGWAAGGLYGLNALGAMSGSLLAGFVLLPSYGLRATVLIAAAANLAIAAVAAGLPWLRRLRADPGLVVAAPAGPAPRPWLGRLIVIGYGVSGFCAMVYQVGWARTLTLTLGSTTYAYSMIFAAFIGGLALGGMAMTPWADRLRRPLLWAAGLEAVIGLSALVTMMGLEWATLKMFGWSIRLGPRFGALAAVRLLTAFGLILAPTMAMGALFPVVLRIYGSVRRGVGGPAGAIYSANTIGAIAGAFVGGQLLLRWLGVQETLLAASLISATVAAAWLAGSELRSPIRWGTAAVGLVLVGLAIKLTPAWDPMVINSGPAFYAETLAGEVAKGEDLAETFHDRAEVLFHRDGVEATVSVIRQRSIDDLSLRINGKTDASSASDMATQLLLAHLPLLLHPAPKRVMVLGLASGVTAGSALLYPIERLDVVEISPEVVAASKYFSEINHLDWSDPRLHLIEDDARNYLALTDARYDAILLEPSNPRVANVSALYTREFFSLVHDRLAPGGICLAFLPIYDMDPEMIKLMFRTLGQSFPEVSLWETEALSDYFVIGSDRPPRVDPAEVVRRAAEPKVAADLARIQVPGGAEVFARFVMGPQTIAAIAGQGPAHTDDRRQLEYLSPRLYLPELNRRTLATAAEVLSHHESVAQLLEPLTPEFEELVRHYDVSRELYYGTWAYNVNNPGPADLDRMIAAWREVLRVTGPSYPAENMREWLRDNLMRRAEAEAQQGDETDAVADWNEAFELNPRDSAAADQLLAYYARGGDRTQAWAWAEKALERNPRDASALYFFGTEALSRRQPDVAEKLLAASIESSPSEPDYRFKYALSLAQQNKFFPAETQLRLLIERFPDQADGLMMLAQVLKDQHRDREAEKYVEAARNLNPDHPLLKDWEKR
jgi:spermidine synthase